MGERMRYGGGLVAVCLAVMGLDARPAAANPNEGEGRSIVRDPDRVYTVVAGEGDAASTVTNPANLGYLQGFNAIVDLALTAPQRRRRGSGVGAMVALPLPLRLLAAGLGYQLVLPWQPESVSADNGTIDPSPDPQGTDDFFHKVSVAVAIPVGSWLKLARSVRSGRGQPGSAEGLSLGVSYSRLISAGNFHANGTRHVDIALSYWPIRYLAIGLVGRAINLPRTGRSSALGPSASVIQPGVIDPELAIRPLGTPALEVAVGARISPVIPGETVRFRTDFFAPRARLRGSIGGVKLFAEAETLRFVPALGEPGGAIAARRALRINAGVEMNFSRLGVSVAPLMSAGAQRRYGVDGVAARLRVSQERYRTMTSPRRRVTKLALAGYRGDRGLWRAIEQLNEIAEQRGVVLIETRGMGLGFAQLEELREAMLRVRNRGGKVIVYLRGGSLRSYFVASVADRIVAHPTTSLSITGMRIQRLYYRELLERLGAKPEFVRMAEYKAWPERVHRTTASDEVASQRHQLKSDIWNHVLRTIARDRGHDVRVIKEWIDDAPVQPLDALGRGMVDELAYADELDERLERWLGRRIRIESPRSSPEHRVDFGPPPRVVVLMISGDIVSGDSFTVPLLGRRVVGDRTLTRQIKRLREDPSVEAVVVRIDSPGGDVGSADAIARALDLLRKEKPVVVSMGNTCASGGYYIATAGQYIYADATTYTGSIGIFYPKVDLSGTLAKLGISVDEEDFGRRAGMRSWFRPYDADERAAAQADIETSYIEFLTRVARARSMTLEQADWVARGRVWSGLRAIDVGLVDQYGGLREAMIRARAMAGLRPGEGVVDIVSTPTATFENLRAVVGYPIPNPLGGALVGSASLTVDRLIPADMLSVMRHLPLPLWSRGGPRLMALADGVWVVED